MYAGSRESRAYDPPTCMMTRGRSKVPPSAGWLRINTLMMEVCVPISERKLYGTSWPVRPSFTRTVFAGTPVALITGSTPQDGAEPMGVHVGVREVCGNVARTRFPRKLSASSRARKPLMLRDGPSWCGVPNGRGFEPDPRLASWDGCAPARDRSDTTAAQVIRVLRPLGPAPTESVCRSHAILGPAGPACQARPRRPEP